MRVELGQAWRDYRTRQLYPTGTVLDLDEATAIELIRMRWAKAAPEPPVQVDPPGSYLTSSSFPDDDVLPGGVACRVGVRRYRRRDLRAEP
jgi:hypothetical protein